jgi:hypothetical protein
MVPSFLISPSCLVTAMRLSSWYWRVPQAQRPNLMLDALRRCDVELDQYMPDARRRKKLRALAIGSVQHQS